MALDAIERDPHYDAEQDNTTMDDDEDGSAAAAHLLHCLNTRLGPGDMTELHRILSSVFDGLNPPSDTAAQDEPVPFKGMPKPGGKMVGMDAAMRLQRVNDYLQTSEDYARRWPSAAKIGIR